MRLPPIGRQQHGAAAVATRHLLLLALPPLLPLLHRQLLLLLLLLLLLHLRLLRPGALVAAAQHGERGRVKHTRAAAAGHLKLRWPERSVEDKCSGGVY